MQKQMFQQSCPISLKMVPHDDDLDDDNITFPFHQQETQILISACTSRGSWQSVFLVWRCSF